MNTYTNADFVNKIAQGDEAAFEAFYEKYQRMVYYVAYKTMQSEADAMDISQETFLQIRKSIGNVRNPQYLQLWINRIVVNKCNMMYRKRNLVLFDDEDSTNPLHTLRETNSEHLPIKTAHYQNDKEVLMKMIDTLPASQRLMVTLMYFEQLSIEEISKICDIPTGTIKSRLSTARSTLKKKIELYETTQQIKLDFKESSLGAMLITAFLWDSTNMTLPLLSISNKGIFKSKHLFATGAGKLLLVCIMGCIGLGGSIYVYHAWQQDRNISPYAKNVHVEQVVKEVSKAEEAYFKLVMFANTKTVMDMRESEEIKQYQMYYHILKEEKGIYWTLFQRTGLDTYYENIK